MSATFNIPDFVERKGSLFLRSDHMNYSRATLNSNWHQARESEPKDYDISLAPTRDLRKCTYQRIGNVSEGSLPKTTYQEHSEQIHLRKEFEEKDTTKPMLNKDTFTGSELDRDTNTPNRGYGSVLPRHNPDFDKRHLDTTYKTDYVPAYPFTPAPEKPTDFPDHSMAYKKCHSQFCDTGDYRRPGWNTWQDESGVYANTHYKREIYKPTRITPENCE